MPSKPRRPAAPRPRQPRATIGAFPDLAAMQAFHAAPGRDHERLLDRAQDIVFEAWEARSARSRIALARKALEVTPLCADAYTLLAEEAASPAETEALYVQAMAAAELMLGPEGFQEYEGEFWGFLETRPYMRARAGLVAAMRRRGDTAAAIGHCEAMLSLNPNDNQGMRYVLAALLLEQDDVPGLRALLARYEDDGGVEWLFARALLAFRAGAADADALARAALQENRHVAAILAGTRQPVFRQAGFIVAGGADEATAYVREFGAAWRRVPGAVEWLRRIAGSLRTR